MKIGALAELTGTPVETIRYYEREGLLPAAARSSSNFRLYAAAHLERLRFIRHCRSLDMSLDEVRALLRLQDEPASDCAEVAALLDAHIGHVQQRILALRALQQQLKALRGRCQTAVQDAGHCGILAGLAEGAPGPVAAEPGHVGGTVHQVQRRKARRR